MSLTLHVFIAGDSLPKRDAWQRAIDALNLPLALDPDLELPRTTGFRPCAVAGRQSGFELYVDSISELLARYPHITGRVGTHDAALSFRWGGDLSECACVMGAVLALTEHWSAVVYYPDDDLICDRARLEQDFRDCLTG